MSSYHRLFARNQLPCRLRQPSANFCQAITIRKPALYGDASHGGKITSRHCLMPSSNTSHFSQQKSLLSRSAAVSATGSTNVVRYASVLVIFITCAPGMLSKAGVFFLSVCVCVSVYLSLCAKSESLLTRS